MSLNWRREGEEGTQWYGHCGPWSFWIYKIDGCFRTVYYFGNESGTIDDKVLHLSAVEQVQDKCLSYALSRTIHLLADLEYAGLRGG